MMRLSDDSLIKGYEELRLEAYMPTPNDVPTIGWGHTKGVKMGQKITKAEAQALFDADVQVYVDAVNRLVKVPLSQPQFDALVSFTFNLGETNLKNSTLLRKLNSGDYLGAANEFLRWNKQRTRSGKFVVLNGLTRRRKEERALFLSQEVKPTALPPKIELETWLTRFFDSLKGWKR